MDTQDMMIMRYIKASLEIIGNEEDIDDDWGWFAGFVNNRWCVEIS